MALAIGYNSGREIAALLAGVVTFVLSWTGVTALSILRTENKASLGYWIPLVAFAWPVSSMGCLFLTTRVLPHSVLTWAQPLFAVLEFPLLGGGILALQIVEGVAKNFHGAVGPEVDSFGWTYLTVFIAGSLISMGVLLISGIFAGATWLLRRFWK